MASKSRTPKYSIIHATLSKQFAREEREQVKELARMGKTTVSSYLRRLIRADYERKVKDFNPELFREYELGGDRSTGNPNYLEGMKRRSQKLKARTTEGKKDV